MPSPIYQTGAHPAQSKIAKSKGGIIVTQVGGATVIRIKPAVGVLGESPVIITDLMIAIDNVLYHWGK